MPDISLIPKDYKEKIGLSTIFPKIGILIFALLILSLLAYGGLFFLKGSLDSQLADLHNQIDELDKQKDEKFEKEVMSLEKALKSLKTILKNHFYWSNLVSKLGSLAVPQITFLSLDGRLEKDGSVNLILDGRSPGYTYLAKQMVSFSQDDLVLDVKVSEIALSTEGGIEFTLNINFLKEVLLSPH